MALPSSEVLADVMPLTPTTKLPLDQMSCDPSAMRTSPAHRPQLKGIDTRADTPRGSVTATWDGMGGMA